MSVPLPPIEMVHQAIGAGTFGQIQWDDRADERARSNPDLQGLTPEGIRRRPPLVPKLQFGNQGRERAVG